MCLKMWIMVFVSIFILLLINRRILRRIYIELKNLPRDLSFIYKILKIHWASKKFAKEEHVITDKFSLLVKLHPNKVAIYCEDQTWTYARMEAFCNKITRYFMPQGFKKGDTVALMLDNCVEYYCIILGLTKLGIIPALINTNLRKKLLLYSITVTKPKALIFGKNYSTEIENILEDLKDIKLFHIQSSVTESSSLSASIDLNKELNRISATSLGSLEKQLPKVLLDDPFVYIYTSGTTGLPKASIMTHSRCLAIIKGLSIVVGITKDDIVYSPLPLYHVAAVINGVGQAIVNGSTTVIRTKFSASHYFKDCIKYKVTVSQYIGELCRYILLAYNQTEPEKHQVRTMFGNGLNPLVWDKLVTKFKIKNIVEFYASTEGVAVLLNLWNKIGPVGYIPWFLQPFNLVALVKCDKTGEVLRDKNGYCIKCGVDEPGLILGKIYSNEALLNYKGYLDSMATKKKIVSNVLTKGDAYFNSGDVLVYDEFGYFYFKDRMGDTFRWKGENVSTFEVESVISNLINMNDVMVYGVEVPQTDGRAGMAAIVDPSKIVDIQALGNALKETLPTYAIPLFLRILALAPLTGTFKFQKYKLREEGYNVNIVTDKLYFFDLKKGNYVSLTKNVHEDIISNRLRF